VRRFLRPAVGLFLLSAVVTRVAEAAGVDRVRLTCGCEPDCWCKRSSLTLFRWVTPRRAHHLLTPADKWMLEESRAARQGTHSDPA
jgi:hypothetical protein